MSLERLAEAEVELSLAIPDSLIPHNDTFLPSLDHTTLIDLQEKGWATVGLMAALINTDGNILMLRHNGRDKNDHGALGPLGETSKQSGPVIEQPLETLLRGLGEELGVEEPADLNLWMRSRGGWVVNQWPRGKNYPDQFACALSFPVFMTDDTVAHLLSVPHANEETSGLEFMAPSTILDMDESELRPGVKPWLRQLMVGGLLNENRYASLQKVDFSRIYESSLRDIEL